MKVCKNYVNLISKRREKLRMFENWGDVVYLLVRRKIWKIVIEYKIDKYY